MTLDELTDHLDAQNTRWTFATRRQRRRIVAMGVELLPANAGSWHMLDQYWRDRLQQRVEEQVRKRYGNPFLVLAIQILINLLIQWWFSRAEHAELASAMREECRRVAG